MAELCEHTNRLWEDNERLRILLEASQAEKSRGPPRQLPPSRLDKGKEAAIPDDIDLLADDELSSDSSPLPRRSPSLNAAEAQSRKRPPSRSSRSISTAQRQVRREASRDLRQSEPAHEYVPERPGGVACGTIHVPSLLGCYRPTHVFLLRPSRTTSHALLSPQSTYSGL